MKKILFTLSLALSALSAPAQDHVKMAFERFKDAFLLHEKERTSGVERLADEVTQTSFSDGSYTTSCTFRVRLKANERHLVDDFYEAFSQDEAICTQFTRQDAHSAHSAQVSFGVPNHTYQHAITENDNLLWGGFFNFDSKETRYAYYCLIWNELSGGEVLASLCRLTQRANTQQPDIRQPEEPRYHALKEAIAAFLENKAVKSTKDIYWWRAAASGQWGRIYNTWGFCLPLSESESLIAELKNAFAETERYAYRTDYKPAGMQANDTQIIIDENGRSIGLGLQTNWDITMAYFNDEDFPRNRYVYALWYEENPELNCVVGEIYEINAVRPNGGVAAQPFVQTSAPSYLYRLGGYAVYYGEAAYDQFAKYNTKEEPDAFSYFKNTAAADVQQMRRALAPSTLPQSDLRSRGINLFALNHELDTMQAGVVVRRTNYQKQLENLQTDFKSKLDDAVKNIEENIALSLQKGSSGIDREHLRSLIEKAYNQENGTFERAYSDSINKYFERFKTESNPLFEQNGEPSNFFRRVFDQFTAAYLGDRSQTDQDLSARFQPLTELIQVYGSETYRRKALSRLVRLHSKPSNEASARNLGYCVTLLDANAKVDKDINHISSSGSYVINNGTYHYEVVSPKSFDITFKQHYNWTRKRIKSYKKNGMYVRVATQAAVNNLAAYCIKNASIAARKKQYYIGKLTKCFINGTIRGEHDLVPIIQMNQKIKEAIDTIRKTKAADIKVRGMWRE